MAFGKRKQSACSAVGGKPQATAAADDFLRDIEDGSAAKKTKRWLDQNLTDTQRNHLATQGIEVNGFDFSWTKHKVHACLVLWNRSPIEHAVEAYL